MIDLTQAIREAVLAQSSIVGSLPAYLEQPTVFTRKPVPEDAPYPMLTISPDITERKEDGINDFRPIYTRDITVYGENDTAAKYRFVEALAFTIANYFHANKHAIALPDGWALSGVTATSPRPAPTDDDTKVGRLVEVTFRLARPRT